MTNPIHEYRRQEPAVATHLGPMSTQNGKLIAAIFTAFKLLVDLGQQEGVIGQGGPNPFDVASFVENRDGD